MEIEDWSIIREKDDKLADVRISLGYKNNVGAYLVFRGNPYEVIGLLDEALIKTRLAIAQGNYKDIRNRPQG